MDESLFTKVISKKDIDALKDIIIFREASGEYNIYDRYVVSKNTDGIYTVTVLGTHTEKNFYKLKNAVAWCSFDKRTLYKDANRLHQLDQLIFGMDTEIQIHTGLIKKASTEEAKLIYLSKLTQEKAKKRNFTYELSHFLNDFKRWQDGLFETKPKY
jgi:hypothetical protein